MEVNFSLWITLLITLLSIVASCAKAPWRPLEKEYATVHPLCIKCTKKGKEAKTRAPNNMATSKAKHQKLT